MQERRILTYIDKEDIPSSAVAVTGNDMVTGNVFYIPLYIAGRYPGTSEITFTIYFDTRVPYVYPKLESINNIPVDKFINSLGSMVGPLAWSVNNNKAITFTLAKGYYEMDYINGGYICYYGHVQKLNIYDNSQTLSEGYLINDQSVSKIPGEGDLKPYAVIKFTEGPFYVRINDSSLMYTYTNYYDPIYVDNE